MPDLAERARRLPATCGVYLFKDDEGTVLYVGKARDLRARVLQYVRGHDARSMVPFLVSRATDVEVVLTDSEKEALVLENTLIKRCSPRYNAQLRDDKDFLHLRIDPREPWPRFRITRRIRDDGARTFGPYSSARRARQTLRWLERHFPLRTCSDRVLASRRRPCLLHQMGRCAGPCVPGLVDPDAYAALVRDAVRFLDGRTGELCRELRARMAEAAAAERFEEAARLRDLLAGIEATLERQKAVNADLGDRDAWGLYREGDAGACVVLPVRSGRMIEPEGFGFREAVGPNDELLSTWLNTWYDGREPPREVLLPEAPGDLRPIEELLGERAGRRVRLRVPERGEKRRLVLLAAQNARERYLRATGEQERTGRALARMAELVGLELPPHRVECFDISTLQGSHPVASCVVFVDGAPARGEYRRYRLRSVRGPDDYAAMREVLRRRLRRGIEEGLLPDLVVVDGGAGQLRVAMDVLDELGLREPRVAGLVKPSRKGARGLDRLVLPGVDEPVALEDHDPALNLLRRLRDESHRVAVAHHRRLRRKAEVGSVVERLPGVGPARRRALLRHFGSVRALLEADAGRIAEVPGIGPVLAAGIHQALHGEHEAGVGSGRESPPGGSQERSG